MGKEILRVMPRRLDQNTAPEQLAPDAAVILQNVDLDFAPGRMKRGPGYQRTQCAAVADFTVTSCFVANRRDCNKLLFYGDAGGVVQVQPPDGTVNCSGPLPDHDGGDSGGS